MKLLFSTTAALTFVSLTGSAHGHGYMFEPLSRNYYAKLFGLTWGEQPDKPLAEYCPHCLNTKGPGSVCGTSEGGTNYDVWLDSLQQPMPWNSNGNIYGESDIITIGTFLQAHHTGHAEVRACPMGRASTQECFDENPLEFVEDLAYDMPKDDNYPERGYYYGSSEFNNQEFTMRFKLPEGLVGEEVLLQWWYFTANSCYPPGYVEYYATNSDLPRNFYNTVVEECNPEQFTVDFYTGDWPERFVNCAEITVVSEDVELPDDFDLLPQDPTPAPILSTQAPVPIIDNPAIAPPAPAPSPSPEPENDSNERGCCSNNYKTCVTWSCNDSRAKCESSACPNMRWLDAGALPASDTCEPRWGSCTATGTAGCCEGLICKGGSVNYKQCLAPGDASPNK